MTIPRADMGYVPVTRHLIKLAIMSLKQSSLVLHTIAQTMKPEAKKVAVDQVRATADLIAMLEDTLS